MPIPFEYRMRSDVYLDVKVPWCAFGNGFAHSRHSDHLSITDTGRNNDRDLFFSPKHALASTGLAFFLWYFTASQAYFADLCTGNSSENGPFRFSYMSLAVTIFAGLHLCSGLC